MIEYLIKRTAKTASKQAEYFPFDIKGFNLRVTYQPVYLTGKASCPEENVYDGRKKFIAFLVRPKPR